MTAQAKRRVALAALLTTRTIPSSFLRSTSWVGGTWETNGGTPALAQESVGQPRLLVYLSPSSRSV
jgi:hypothetical protein